MPIIQRKMNIIFIYNETSNLKVTRYLKNIEKLLKNRLLPIATIFNNSNELYFKVKL